LYQAQIGQQHESAKMLRGFAETVWQVRADDASGTYRAVYVAQLEDAIYVLHAFQKKSKSGIATPRRELDLIRQRLLVARKLAGR
jgi:phage-related protein